MTKAFAVLLLLCVTSASHPVFAKDSDQEAIRTCLKAWGKTPFNASGDVEHKTLSASVKVFGIGKAIEDTEVTQAPALVLVKPAVNVLGGSTFRLMNPNGWYCLKANVNVLGASHIVAHCKAKIASSSGGATVLGSDDDHRSVTVLGSTKIVREGCAEP